MAMLAGSVPGDFGFGRFLSICPPITSALVQLSPIRTVYGIHKYKTVGEFPVLPYVSLIFTVSLWGIYGILLGDPTLIYGNIIGTTLGCFYTGVYHYYATDRRQIYCYYAFLLAVYVSVGFIIKYTEKPEVIIGATAVGAQYLFLISPFVTLSRVLKTKSVDSLPFDLSFIQFWNSTLWTMYSWVVAADLILLLSSVVGIFVAFLQLLCHVKYGCFTQSVKELFCSCCMSPSIVDFIEEEKIHDHSSTDSESIGTTDVKVDDLELGKAETPVEPQGEVILM